MGLLNLRSMNDCIFSVVVPCYNRAHFLPRAIQSILDQTIQSWELIIVDDGSTDDTSSLVTNFKDSRIQYVRLHSNNGAAHCRNLGIRNAKGRYVAFLDSDDAFEPEFMQQHYDLLEAGQYDATVAECRRLLSVSGRTVNIAAIEPKSNLLTEFVTKKIVWKMYPVWRRTFLLKTLICFDERLRNCQDYQFNCFAILNKPKMGYLHRCLGTKYEADIGLDPVKIQHIGSVKSLRSHLLSRILVLKYARITGVDDQILSILRRYVLRHRISCYRAAFGISITSLIKLVKSYRALKHSEISVDCVNRVRV